MIKPNPAQQELFGDQEIPSNVMQIEFQNWSRAPMTQMMLEKLRKLKEQFLEQAINQCENQASDQLVRASLSKARAVSDCLQLVSSTNTKNK